MTHTVKKSLGQHWLRDRLVLESIVSYADLSEKDTVLEIGPGLGTLTSVLLARAKQVIAVEFDTELAAKLPGQFPGKSLVVRREDILTFDLSVLPVGYKAVANLPYYITSKIIRTLCEATNSPALSVLLVQEEVAQRLAAKPGNMSLLAVSAQLYNEVSLGPIIKAELFSPPPKVDSQVVILRRHPAHQLSDTERVAFFHVVKAGFSSRRKKLRTALAGGLAIDKAVIEKLLYETNIDPHCRAESLSVSEWLALGHSYTRYLNEQ